MNHPPLRIVAAVVDTTHLTLYKESGETVVLPQGDPRIRRIINEATPGLTKHGYAYVDLHQENTFSEFEAQSTGGIKLFRVAKDKLKKIFGFGKAQEEPDMVKDVSIGLIPVADKLKQTQEAVANILAQAVPVASPEYTEISIATQANIVEADGKTPGNAMEVEAAETVVAVVDGKIIPGMEKIKTQFSRAVDSNSTKNMDTFLRRLSAVIEHRSHSVEDLLKFLERGDLPIAEDGSILIYKVLRKQNGKYVDCHTGLVSQWVGAYVCMDESLVDRNRNNECSNGLHVARRGYVSGFSGDVCVLAKLAPEDVIAVPAYDANKMRVCGYHIIKELSEEQYTLLRQNRPITENEAGKKLLADALQGKHIHKTHEVRITGHKGKGVIVTELGKPEVKVEQKEEAPKETKVAALANPSEEALDQPVCPKEVIKTIEQLSRKDQARLLYEAGDIEKLKAFKKSAKVSWEKLGIPDPDIKPPVKKPPVPVVKAKSTPMEALLAEKPVKAESKKAKTTDSQHTVNGVVLGEGSTRERIQKLLSIGLTSVGVAKAVLELKKKSKKSWDVLGVTPDQVAQITKLAQ